MPCGNKKLQTRGVRGHFGAVATPSCERDSWKTCEVQPDIVYPRHFNECRIKRLIWNFKKRNRLASPLSRYLSVAQIYKIVIFKKQRLVSKRLYYQFTLWRTSSSQLRESDRFIPIVSCWMCILPPQNIQREGRDREAASASVRSADPVQGLLPAALLCERSCSQREYSQWIVTQTVDCGVHQSCTMTPDLNNIC